MKRRTTQRRKLGRPPIYENDACVNLGVSCPISFKIKLKKDARERNAETLSKHVYRLIVLGDKALREGVYSY